MRNEYVPSCDSTHEQPIMSHFIMFLIVSKLENSKKPVYDSGVSGIPKCVPNCVTTFRLEQQIMFHIISYLNHVKT